jgi:hypothetical protein
MHRLITNTPEGLMTDHINGNKLDNRRLNLRVCTNNQNQYNNKPHKDKQSSIYKGVTWNKSRNYWSVIVRGNNRYLFSGAFSNEVAAACAYDYHAKLHFGEYARINGVKMDNWQQYQILKDIPKSGYNHIRKRKLSNGNYRYEVYIQKDKKKKYIGGSVELSKAKEIYDNYIERRDVR